MSADSDRHKNLSLSLSVHLALANDRLITDRNDDPHCLRTYDRREPSRYSKDFSDIHLERNEMCIYIYIYAKFGQAVEPDRRSGAISFGLNGREVG